MTRLVAGWIGGAIGAFAAGRATVWLPPGLRRLAAGLVPAIGFVLVILVAELGGNELGGVTLGGRRAALQVGTASIASGAVAATVVHDRLGVAIAAAAGAVAAIGLVDDLAVEDRPAVAVLVASSILLSSLVPQLVAVGLSMGAVGVAWLATTRSPDLVGPAVVAGAAVGAVAGVVAPASATTAGIAAALAASLGVGLVASSAQIWVMVVGVLGAVAVLGGGRFRRVAPASSAG